MDEYNKYIKKCIELAKAGEGHVSPNPLVGAVIIDNKGNTVGEGCHKQYGEAHAEVNALEMAGVSAQGATLFVSLEPCSHYGKTPPCADLVIERGIKKLIVGMTDPNPEVSGRGIKKCQQAGIEVITGVLEDECKKLNEIFIKNMLEQKPFVAIKTACTMDGKIATKTGSSKWITSSEAREEVQRLRNKYDAIITGSNTVVADNPSMNCRIDGGMNPIRIVVDSTLKTSPDSKIYNDDETRTIIATINQHSSVHYPQNVEFIVCPLLDEKIDLSFLIDKLYQQGIRSILIEAGAVLNGAFVKQSLVDKVYMYMAPKILGDKDSKSWVEGFDVDDINKSQNIIFGEIKNFSPDILVEGYFK